jgi:hypothetical protein
MGPPVDYLFVEYIDAVTNEVKCEPFENIGIGWSMQFDAHCLECKPISNVTVYAVGGQSSNDNSSKLRACCGEGGEGVIGKAQNGDLMTTAYIYVLDCAAPVCVE